MPRDHVLRLYCDVRTREALRQKQPLIQAEVRKAFLAAGWQVIIMPDHARAKMPDEGYHMVTNQTPPNLFCLNLRSAYLPAFWRIEETNDRTRFTVAQAAYDPDSIDAARARDFVARWRPRLLGGAVPRDDGFIFIPLQDQLLRRRRFQTLSPVEMIRATLQADPGRAVKATLHPRESYDGETLAALQALTAEYPQFELSTAPSFDLLWRCAYVVTETSGMALQGFFAAKPAVLFGQIDFHHPAANVDRLGVAAAFATAQGPPPDFDRYLFWFLRRQAIAQFEVTTQDRILARCRKLGWPV